MRKQFVTTVESLLPENKKLVLLLGDIGVFGFRKSFELYPDRAYNIGILEQATISFAAGMAMTGFIPVVHTIATFLIERSLEQLKDDFCYQRLGGNFVSVGGSYDYASLGCTHHCPDDVGLLKNLPGMEIVLPGTPEEFDRLFRQSYANGHPSYFRLSERKNSQTYPVNFGKAQVIKQGKLATVVVVGPLLEKVLQATEEMDVTVLYYTTLSPFDSQTLRKNCPSGKILLCEPYYKGALSLDVTQSLAPRPIIINYIGLDREFLTNYGTAEEHDQKIGFTSEKIRKKLLKLIKD